MVARALLVPGVLVALCVTTVSAAGQTITQTAQLLPNGSVGNQFGGSVDVDGDTLVVGAPYEDVDAVANVGAAYVYRRTNRVWVLEQRLTPPGSVHFGASVAISGDHLAITASG